MSWSEIIVVLEQCHVLLLVRLMPPTAFRNSAPAPTTGYPPTSVIGPRAASSTRFPTIGLLASFTIEPTIEYSPPAIDGCEI